MVDITALDDSVAQAIAAVNTVGSLTELDAIKKQYVGEGSVLVQLQRAMGTVPKEHKAEYGKAVNAAKQKLQQAFTEAFTIISHKEELAKLAAENVDVTLPVNSTSFGALHPITQLIAEVEQIFIALGWEIASGPEVEAEYFNFDALNFPPNHPARTMQDTFYIAPENSGLVLRTHTSPVQVRTLLERTPPVYMLCPGRVFRTDALDATHTPVFTQIEGLAVDKGLTIGHLKGTLELLAQKMFGPDTRIRLRPHYFPFTEPSLELDIWFTDKVGGPGWIEWGGCGMVHPNVLRVVGIDPTEYQGFAFGMGLERTLQFRNGISDMRTMVDGDIRFTAPFGIGQ